jgi:hypothetical protein
MVEAAVAVHMEAVVVADMIIMVFPPHPEKVEVELQARFVLYGQDQQDNSHQPA